MAKILVVDDEVAILTVLDRLLKQAGHEPVLATNPEDALARFAEGDVDLLLTDLRLDASLDGFDVMRECRRQNPDLPTIVITAYGTVDIAIKAIRKGADDFVCKPFPLNELKSKVEQALGNRLAHRLSKNQGGDMHYGSLVGESPRMLEVYRVIAKAGESDLPVLIQGESGTGKELVAGAIHRISKRSGGAWMAMNCAAVSPLLLESEMFGHVQGAFTGASSRHDGMFIAAQGGTLFLDEVATIRRDLQAKLLRALEESEVRRIGDVENTPVDVRIISATSCILADRVARGEFRKDLLYRLDVINITLPPLRERENDWLLLAEFFCRRESERLKKPVSLDESALEVMGIYNWPGNVRELQNAIACASILSGADGLIKPDVLPPAVIAGTRRIMERDSIHRHREAGSSLDEYLKEVEKGYVDRVVQEVGGNRSEAANCLGISRATFYRKYGDDSRSEE